ncbi:hypothetical protein OPT61_g2488 [Boeremia exigua]|uniref:Uncharacterized protein n=1 Tax=Boeremia exigua TaxID=749465 RepID=A0ACC2ILJ8_9PLEO|nr:hypothetical protein OPT61_g2488 [Boeremia exigua]
MTTILVTGASRGIGKGLVAAYLNLPSTIVVAAVRNAASADSLLSLPKAYNSRLVIIEVDVASVDTIKRGIASLASEHNINSLDVVLANAAKAGFSPKVTESEISDIQPFVAVNAYGQFELYKAVAPLLRNSKKESKGKFIYMSSAAGSLTAMSPILDVSAYGASKAIANFLFRWLSFEQQEIVIWAQHPGVVATDIAKATFVDLKTKGIDLAPFAISVEESCQSILKVIDNATLENTHGKFFGPDGGELPW